MLEDRVSAPRAVCVLHRLLRPWLGRGALQIFGGAKFPVHIRVRARAQHHSLSGRMSSRAVSRAGAARVLLSSTPRSERPSAPANPGGRRGGGLAGRGVALRAKRFAGRQGLYLCSVRSLIDSTQDTGCMQSVPLLVLCFRGKVRVRRAEGGNSAPCGHCEDVHSLFFLAARRG